MFKFKIYDLIVLFRHVPPKRFRRGRVTIVFAILIIASLNIYPTELYMVYTTIEKNRMDSMETVVPPSIELLSSIA